MLRYCDTDIVFSELPDEVTLAVNLTDCPFRCPGCHSPHLQTQTGDPFTTQTLAALCERCGNGITAVCLMGGDRYPDEVARLLCWLRENRPELCTGWYSGRESLPEGFPEDLLDYLKLGPYRETLGGLRSPQTNQRFFRREKAADGSGTWVDETFRFRR